MISSVKLLLLLSHLVVSCASDLISFDAFIRLHGRSYVPGSSTYVARHNIYKRNVAAALAQNQRVDRLWTAGVNHLSDWSFAELESLRGWDGSQLPGKDSIPSRPGFLQRSLNLPAEKLWTGLAMTDRIADQGPCGSCWAVATASVLAAHFEINYGVDRTFSSQQMVSCTPNPRECGGQGGCKGATAELAMEWVLNNGCVTDTDVPYRAVNGICTSTAYGDFASIHQHNGSIAAAPSLPLDPQAITGQPRASHNGGGRALGMVGWETLTRNEMEPLLRALVDHGPAVIAVGASAWTQYKTGVFDGCVKDVVVDHAVVALGYGETRGVKYLLIQNSWGPGWGEGGKIRMLRHALSESYCGLNHKPEVGMGCKGETAAVPVCGMCGILFDSVVPHFDPQIRQGATLF